ncbi:MAG: pilus assembly protein [Lachnospiraceae bacterium]|nr:pilus assembly protein [Lachnospiraceae bacterium]
MRKYLKGSYTVEAAVIFSTVFFVLAALIISMFYLHDRAVAQSAACEAAVAGSNFIKTEERKKAAETVKNLVGEERFLGSRNIGRSVAVGEKEVRAVWRGTYPIPGFTAKYLSGNEFTIYKTWNCEVLNPADAIRKLKGIGDLFIGGDE